jgi:ABC-type dipeptide/oligopeptide/nickel transport system ATPase component
MRDYPHQLSGGMQQRAMIAMALACRPKLLVADEPTTALDVTIQAQILDQMRQLKRELGMGMMLITHNFGIIRGIADRVAVMFRGRIVEEGATEEVLRHPQHPYTRALIACIPQLGQRRARLTTINHAEIEALGG